jgi:hypothetical protein
MKTKTLKVILFVAVLAVLFTVGAVVFPGELNKREEHRVIFPINISDYENIYLTLVN